MTDKYGNDVIVAVHLNKYQDRMTVNRIASLYSKSDNMTNENHIERYINKQIQAGNLLDASAKKAPICFTSRGLQLLKLVQTIIDANNNVSQSDKNVNIYSMQNGENNSSTGKASVRGASNEEIAEIQAIGRKRVNDFTTNDIKATENFARRYFKEMGVKSPFFRAWFGDWRANDTGAVKVASKRENAQGTVKNLDTSWDIQVSGKVFNETGYKAAKNVNALPYLDYINDIVENAVLLDTQTISSQKAKSQNSALMHSLYAIADMGEGKELIKLYVEELDNVNSDGTIKRAYQLQNIENQQLKSSEFSKKLSSIISTADVKTILDLHSLVKQYDKKFFKKN